MKNVKISFKQKLIVNLIVLVSIVYVCVAFVPVSAAQKDVTGRYKKAVTNTLNGIGTYLDITSGRSLEFKYDVYAKTTMACLKYGESQIYGKTEKEARKAVLPLLKQYFKTSVFKVRDYNENEINQIASSYIYKEGNKIGYLKGNWGLWYPSGRVTKILQTSSEKFIATYTVNWYDRSYLNEPAKKLNCIGIYKIYLQKKGNKFYITNIKRTYQSV